MNIIKYIFQRKNKKKIKYYKIINYQYYLYNKGIKQDIYKNLYENWLY